MSNKGAWLSINLWNKETHGTMQHHSTSKHFWQVSLLLLCLNIHYNHWFSALWLTRRICQEWRQVSFHGGPIKIISYQNTSRSKKPESFGDFQLGFPFQVRRVQIHEILGAHAAVCLETNSYELMLHHSKCAAGKLSLWNMKYTEILWIL